MNRARFVLLSLGLTVAVAAATKELPYQVRNVIERSLAGERVAVARYEAFAAKAVEEGYPGAAALFRAQAAAERTHAERFAKILRDNEVPVPPEEPVTPKAGTTEENLRSAATAEALERDGIYREAVETCRRHGAEDIAKIFDQTRDSEVEHANLCNSAARNPASIKEPKAFYVCNACGYTTDVKLSFCPACQKKVPLREIH